MVEGRVLHRNPAAKLTLEPQDHLRGQADLRHQHQGLAAQLQAPGNELQIHRRLSAACDAMQQRHPWPAHLQLPRQDVIDRRLLGV